MKQTMGEGIKKEWKWNPIVVERLSEKYGLTKHYIRQCLRGERSSETSNTIRKEYLALGKKIKAALAKK